MSIKFSYDLSGRQSSHAFFVFQSIYHSTLQSFVNVVSFLRCSGKGYKGGPFWAFPQQSHPLWQVTSTLQIFWNKKHEQCNFPEENSHKPEIPSCSPGFNHAKGDFPTSNENLPYFTSKYWHSGLTVKFLSTNKEPDILIHEF